MHFEILVEELSAEKALRNILSEIVTGIHTFKIITHQGKQDLLKKLPSKLKGYSRWITNDYKIIVLIDRDNQNCIELKNLLEGYALNVRLITKSSRNQNQSFTVLNRIAIEELEAWFFGDEEAVRAAYPRVSPKFTKKAEYRNPDKIKGGTWEALERILQTAGYFKTGYSKTEAANNISKNMRPLSNRSKSFRVFWDGITECLSN
jgi:hypothetical protein